MFCVINKCVYVTDKLLDTFAFLYFIMYKTTLLIYSQSQILHKKH